jgi:mRNA interferase MazF
MTVGRGAVYLVSLGDPPLRGGSDSGGPIGTERESFGRGGGTILRPVVLVSREAINQHSPVVVICPLVEASGVPQLYPSDVMVRAPEAGLTSDCVILTGQIRAIARVQLMRLLGNLSDEMMRQVDLALRITLDLA